MAEHRVVRDTHCGYTVQIRRWWLPFWLGTACTKSTLREAESMAEGYARLPVKYLGTRDNWRGEFTHD